MKRTVRVGIFALLVLGVAIPCLHYATRPPPPPPAVVIPVGTNSGPIRIFPGIGGILIIAPDGTLWRWGRAGFHDLAALPTQVGSLGGWVHAVCGNNGLLAIRDDGTLWQAGYVAAGNIPSRDLRQVGNATNWTTAAVSDVAAAALRTDGTLWTWGDSMFFGSLGAPGISSRAQPGQVGDLRWAALALDGSNAGFVGLTSDGRLFGWGKPYQRGPTYDEPTPLAISNVWRTASLLNPVDRDGALWSGARAQWEDSFSNRPFSRITDGVVPGRFALDRAGVFSLTTNGTLTLRRFKSGTGGRALEDEAQRSDTRARWIQLFDGATTDAGVTDDGTVWVWGTDWGREPQLTFLSQVRRAVHVSLNELGALLRMGPLSSSLQLEGVHRTDDAPRPLLRFVTSSDPPTAPAPPTQSQHP